MADNHFTHWTLTDRAKFIKLKIEGKSNQELANIFKRTYHSIGAYTRELVKQGYLIVTGGSGTSLKYRGVTAIEFEKLQKKGTTKLKARNPEGRRGPYKTKKANIVKKEMAYGVKESKHTVSNSITYYKGGLITVNNKLYKEVGSL